MTRRRFPPGWLWAVWLLLSGAIAWLWLGDPGDDGMRNAWSMVVVLVGLSAGFLWFVLRSAVSGRVRATVAGVAVVVAVAAGAVLRIDGVSGSLIPKLGLRFGAGERELPRVVAERAASDPRGPLRSSPHDFPGFLGRERDAFVRDVELARDWAARPPECLWRREVGAGWSGFAVVGGVAVTMEQRGDVEAVTAYDVRTGTLLWETSHPGRFTHFLGGDGPRSTPAIDEGRVYALGALGRLECLDGASGEVLWARDLLADQGVTPEMEAANVQYGRSNSPLITGELVVVPVGGDDSTRLAGLVAYDKRDGRVVWEGPPRHISFSSPRRAMLADVDQILIVNEDTVSGHSPVDGTLLWEVPWPGRTHANASVSQAVPVPPDRVFVSKGYGEGAALFELVRAEPASTGGLEARELWHQKRALRTKLTNVIVKGDHVYGLSDGMLECVELETGRRAWKDGRYGHGQILRVGELLLVLSEEGEVVLIEPTPDEPDRVVARFQALEGKTWNNPALVGDLLVVRNAQEAAVYRLPLSVGAGSD